MNKLLVFTVLIFLPNLMHSQEAIPSPTPASVRLNNAKVRSDLLANSLVKNVPFESIGPSIFSGRVADVAVNNADPTQFYVAYASGGLWKTVNNGQSFTPLFDNEVVMTMGDIAVDWARNIIWAGTGEVNSSRSSYSGVGVYKSEDDGKTWQFMGLPESHHIGRIILHPTDPNIVWVAALGHLYSPNPERGVYKTVDGGKNWYQVLYTDENAGAIDLAIDPNDANTMYAAMWERERRAWNFVESGKGSGIYKSTDGGESWEKISTEKSGFPVGKGVGRIGLDIAVKNGKSFLVAVVDNQDRRPKEEEEEEGLTKEMFKMIDREAFLKLEVESLNDFLKDNGFPKKYNAEKVMEMVRLKEIEPNALAEYLENANALLFDTPVVGAEVYTSTDGGATWKKTHKDYLDDLYYSYGYYFGQIRVAPQNPEKIYIFGVPILVSNDGGETWNSINESNVHGDHHALWINPQKDGHLILGNDGGINISYDDGENWVKCNTPPLGQFYHIAVDLEKNYNVYGGLQDNGSWYGPHTYKASNRWHGSGQYPYKSFVGGDGMQTAVDTRDNATIYGGFQFGFYYRINKNTGQRTRITPQHELGERPYRWNWQTPIHLSKHNQDILYIGGNMLFRSMNQGDDWETISPDLTKGGKKGDVPFGTLSAIHESPLKFGLLYVGTDDGLVQVSKDGGNSWTDITAGLPQNYWISRVQASKHDQSRVFVSLNGYRWDNFESHVYLSNDYGATWERIGMDLPSEPVNVIKEDPIKEDIIYLGTDHGLYVSLDRGKHFMPFNNGLPNVPIHDVVIHPIENDIIVGTHGRSLYLAEVEEVQQLGQETIEKELFVFDLDEVRYRDDWGRLRQNYQKEIFEPAINIALYAKNEGEIEILILHGDTKIYEWKEQVEKGLNYFTYNGLVNKEKASLLEKKYNEFIKNDKDKVKLEPGKNGAFYLLPGTYKVKFKLKEVSIEKELKVEEKK